MNVFRIRAGLLVLWMATAALGDVNDFQLVVAETPPVSGYGQPVERYEIAGTGGEANRLSDIPAELTDDPASVAFRSRRELFVGNRSAHSGNGSVSRFEFDAAFTGFTQGPTITGNGLTDVHQIAFNPVDGELFCTNWTGGIMSRFTFDESGQAVANGTIVMPDGSYQLGVAIRSVDQQLFVSSYSFVRRFSRNPDGTYTHIASFSIPGATSLHYMTFRDDELYICDVYADAVYRFVFDDDGNPVTNGSVSSSTAINVAFSPDGMEMFVASHIDGGISRFLHEAGTDSWAYENTMETPTLGGIATTTTIPGDYDDNGDVNLDDYAVFVDCMAGPEQAPNPSLPNVTPQRCLDTFDIEFDEDVDSTDFAVFQAAFTGL